MRLKLLFLFFCMCSMRLGAQDFSYIHYGVAEGMPSSEVYQIHQDKNGFIWFATDNGVARFDGSEIVAYHAKQGLPDPVVFGFTEDHKGRMWFRSYSGRLAWMENGIIHKFPFNDTLASLCRRSILHSIYIDSLNRVWLGAGEFSGNIDMQGHIDIKNNPPRQLYYHSIEKSAIVGLYWPSSLVDRVSIDGHDFSIENASQLFDNQTVNAIRWRNKVYLSMANSIFEYDGHLLKRVIHGIDHVISMSVDRQGRLWVGYRETGVQCYTDDTFVNRVKVGFLNDKTVTGVIEDDEHGFWFSTLQNGAYYVPNFSFLNYSLPAGRKIIYARREGKRTILSDEKGALTFMENQAVVSSEASQFKGQILFSIFADSRKNIWASTNRSAFLMDSLFHIKKVLPVQNDFFERNDTIFGLSRVRVLKYSTSGERIKEIQIETIHRSMLNSPPYVVMSGRTGIDVFDANFKFMRSLDAFKNYKVAKLTNLNDSLILVSTIGSGYIILRKGSWNIVSGSEGKNFIGDNVYATAVVDSMLWLGTEKGIAITPVKAIVQNAPSFIFLDKQSGLLSNKINLLTYSSPDVWAFTDQGFTILSKDPTIYRADPPRFYFKNVLINDLPSNLLADNTLSFDRNNIQLNFGFINFKNHHILLRSRLVHAGEWHYSDDRSLSYFSLAPGSYNFQLQYTTDMVHWVDAVHDIPFVILQPWWRTSWFQALIIAVIMLILIGIFGSRMSVLRIRNEKLNVMNETKKNYLQAEIETLERERSRIAKDLHDGIGMNLTVLKLHLHELLKKNTPADSAHVEEQLKATIQEIRAIVHNLTPSGIALFGLAESVRDYIVRTTSHVGVKVELFSSGKKIMEPKISLFSFRIIQELLSNSLKHSNANVITIRINGFENTLNIIYQDNGIGFDPAKCKYGAGLMNIQARLEALNGTFEFSSGDGVMYIINIPLIRTFGDLEVNVPQNINMN